MNLESHILVRTILNRYQSIFIKFSLNFHQNQHISNKDVKRSNKYIQWMPFVVYFTFNKLCVIVSAIDNTVHVQNTPVSYVVRTFYVFIKYIVQASVSVSCWSLTISIIFLSCLYFVTYFLSRIPVRCV